MIRSHDKGVSPLLTTVVVVCCCLLATPTFGGHFSWDQNHDSFTPDPPEDPDPPPDDDPDPSDPDPHDPDCNDNPDQPHCAPDYCPNNPDDERCTDPEPDCGQIPSHEKCQPDYCKDNPDDPFCDEPPEDDPPEEDPSDPDNPPEPDPGEPPPPDEGEPERPQEPDPDQWTCGSPFEAATGEFLHRVTDQSVESLGPDFAFTRVYASQSRRNGPLGPGWSHLYDIRLIPVSDGVEVAAVCREDDGKLARFRRRADGTYRPPLDFYSELTHEVDGTWTLREKSGHSKRFDADGLLIAIADRSGNEMTFAYDATGFLETATTAASQTFTFTKGPNGRIDSITDPLGRVTWYDYDVDGYLTRVTNALNEEIDYVYDVDGRLFQILDPLDRVAQELTYDAFGRLKSYREAGEQWTVEYFPSKDKVIKVDSAGNLWKIYYNQNGNVVRRVDPLGSVLSIGYDKRLRPRLITDQRGHRWEMRWDDRGNAVRSIDPLGNATDFLFDAATGELVESVVFPGGRSVDLTYDPPGRLTEVSDAEGKRLEVEYNADGTIDRLIDANQQATAYLYHPDGYVSQATSALGSTAQFEYDDVGNLTAFVDPDGRRFEFEYDDLNRLEKIKDPDLNETTHAYAPRCPTCAENRLPSLIVDASGREISWQYDAQGRIVQRTRGGTEVTTVAYDTRGNLDSITDPRGKVTSYTWDDAARLESVTEPDSGVTDYGYDPVGNLVRIDDAEGHTTTWTLDPLGRTTAVSSPAAGTTSSTYTAEGLRETRTDARGVTAAYAFDGRARLTGLTFPSSADDVSFVWDEAASQNGGGRLTSLVDAAGTTRYHYDLDGRLAGVETDVEGATRSTTYSYTPRGLVDEIVYPSGLRVDYGYDSRGLASSVSVNDGVQTRAAMASALYDLAGRRTSIVHGNGVAETWSYDNFGRVESIAAGTVHQVSYTRGLGGRVTAMTDGLNAALSQGYSYDDVGRLDQATGPWGTLAYTYDLVGNRLTRTETSCVATYQYSSNRLSSISGCSTAAYQYDAAGNTLSDGNLEYQYDQLGRIARVLDGGVELASYTYNGAGQRVKKELAASTVYYHYDSRGNLIEEIDGLGAVLASYVYLPGGRPLAVLVDGDLYHYHLDQLGTPRRVTDAAGAVAWSGEFLPFGGVWQEGGTLDQRLRFRGQLHDDESGLHYNWYRFYDPSTGRFLRVDPLGSHGDWIETGEPVLPNSNAVLPTGRDGAYLYAFNDPVNRLDRDGRVVIVDDAAIITILGVTAAVAWLVSPQGQQALQDAAEAAEDLFDYIVDELGPKPTPYVGPRDRPVSPGRDCPRPDERYRHPPHPEPTPADPDDPKQPPRPFPPPSGWPHGPDPPDPGDFG